MTAQRRILKSWKEISSYLGVGVRTAQRWTALRGLPVRRPGAGRSAVLGFADDIDSWLRTTKTRTREPLEGIVATEILTTRPARPRRLDRELETVLGIARLIARASQREVMHEIARFAMTECKAESSGFSILEVQNNQDIFRWRATQGRMSRFEAGWTPADFSPCGVCLERNAVQLFQYPERFYAYLEPIAPIAELLLIPIFERNRAIGTIWVISHSGRRKFDREDARLLLDLGELVGATFSRIEPVAKAKRRPAKRPGRRS